MIAWLIVFVLLITVGIMFYLNHQLKNEKQQLQDILVFKDTTIKNLEASRLAVKDVLEDFTVSSDVVSCLEAGESRESLSQRTGIDKTRIERMIKIDQVKKSQEKTKPKIKKH